MTDDQNVPDLVIRDDPPITLPEEIVGRCEGVPFTLKKGESKVLSTRRGEVRVTYEIAADGMSGGVRAEPMGELIERDPKEPALTPEEWAEWREGGYEVRFAVEELNLLNVAQLIAVANDDLPDDHPGKITHARLDALRVILWNWEGERPGEAAEQLAFIDALERYLPPRGTPPLRVERGGLSALPSDLERKLNDQL
jgi:hypothetical protein